MKMSHRLAFVPLIILMIPVGAFAQNTLRGTVIDSVTNEVLIGANAYLQGTALGGVTDREGQYRITGVQEGTYVLRISYIGYKQKDIEIKVVAGESAPLNVSLVPDILQGEEVLITAQARGQIAAINQQISSNTIVNVISEEKIKELPDANAAEAIGRLPGVSIIRSGGEANKVILRGMSDKFASITVDGVRIAATDANERGVDLSTVSQSSLAGVELYKTLTPDKDAEAIAGSVNLVTRKAPSERVLSLDSKGAYGRMNKTFAQYDFSLKYGERFFDNILGVQLLGNLESRDRSNEVTNTAWTILRSGQGISDYELRSLGLQYTKEDRGRGGFSALVDINTPDDGSIRINNIYNKTNRDYTVYKRSYPSGSDYVTYSARDVEQDIKTFNSSVRGENHLVGVDVNWGLSFAQSFSDNPYDYELLFDEPSSDTSGMNHPPNLKSSPELLIPYAWNNFNASKLDTAFFRYEKNLERQKTASLDLKKAYTVSDLTSGEVKFGGKYQSRNRFREARALMAPYWLSRWSQYERLPDGTFRLKNFQGTRFENLRHDGATVLLSNFLTSPPENRNVFDRYALYPLIDKDALRQWYELNQYGALSATGAREYESDASYSGDYYDVVERVSAGYVMNTLNVAQWLTVIAGVRVESENDDYKARYSPQPISGFPLSGAVYDTTTNFKETIWLPNIQATFALTDFMKLRLAAYKALARPDFNNRLNKFIAVSANASSLTVGNPNLRAAKASNFEINTSFFGNDIGLISVSAFYKDIQDMYHIFNSVPVKGNRILDSLGIQWRHPFINDDFSYNLTFPYNSSRPTKVWGIEFEHQANLNFLPGALKNIVLNYNFSLIRSETFQAFYNFRLDSVLVHDPEFGDFYRKFDVLNIFERRTRLESQPEFFFNVAVGYDLGGFSARVSLFHQGDYTQTFTGDGNGDRIVRSYSRLDLSVKQRITDNISLLLNVNNLTNTEEPVSTVYNKGWDLPVTSQKYGLTGDFGVRIEL